MTNICGTCITKAPVGELQICRGCGLRVCYHVRRNNEHRCPGRSAISAPNSELENLEGLEEEKN